MRKLATLISVTAVAGAMYVVPPGFLSQTASAQTPAGLVSCWPADGNTADIIAGNDGSLLGTPAPTFVTDGARNEAFSFIGDFGSGEQVEVGNNTALEPAAVSVSLWMRSTGPDSGFRYLVAKGANGCASASYAFYLAGGLRFYVTTGPGSFVLSPASNSVFNGAWHHVVGTYSPDDPSSVRLYVDGSLVGSTSSPGIAIDYTNMTNTDLHFGEWPNACTIASEYVGDIDEIQIYNAVLTPDEATALYNGGAPLACSPAPAPDADDDGIPDSSDNCPFIANPEQGDNDGDGHGDVCDGDDDNDGIVDDLDNCPIDANTLQEDFDADGLGNACDPTLDGSGIVNETETRVVEMMDIIVVVDPPGGNGMIAKLTGKGGVLQKLGNAVDAFNMGLIDVETYLSELQDALDKLTAFDNQLAAKTANGQIIDPEATDLADYSAEIRVIIDALIAEAGG